MMDARKNRIGEHAARQAPPWATAALGPAPAHPLNQLDWQKRASSIGAWRELSGYDHPTDPIGPEPVTAAPDARAAWYEALAALGPADSPDVRGMPHGRLLHLRDTYPVETAWAPPYVGDELRQVRAAAWDARLAGLRAAAEADAAQGTAPPASRAARQLAASYQALHGPTPSARRCLPRHGRPRRLGRRHPRPTAAGPRGRRRTAATPSRPVFPPLRSAEPEPAAPATRRLALTPDGVARRDRSVDRGPGRRTRTFAERLAQRQSQGEPVVPRTLTTATSAARSNLRPTPCQLAILQPPKPRDPTLPRGSSSEAMDGSTKLGSRRLTAAAWYHRGARGRRPELV